MYIRIFILSYIGTHLCFRTYVKYISGGTFRKVRGMEISDKEKKK